VTDPLKPSVTLLTKLGSALVHAAEATEPGGHPFDIDALRGLLADDEIVDWIAAMDGLALLPKKRSSDQ
jgi:hypothetical protein